MIADREAEVARAEAIALARELYRRYRVRCLWDLRSDLDIDEDVIPIIIQGLRANGDLEIWREACRLQTLFDRGRSAGI